MILNYIKLTFRLMLRNKFFNMVSITGLALGFAAFFVLWPFSQSELNSDAMWKDHKDIYRYTFNWSWTDNNLDWDQTTFSGTTPELGQRIGNDFPQVYSHTRLLLQKYFDRGHSPLGTEIVISIIQDQNKKQFRETHFSYADPNLFDFFGITLLKGNKDKVLEQANAIVISQAIARKYFGTEEAIGKVLIANDSIPFVVSGVFQNLPRNSHLNFELVASTVGIYNLLPGIGGATQCYYKIKAGTDISAMNKEIDKSAVAYFGSKFNWDTHKLETDLQPLSESAFAAMQWDGFEVKSKSHLVLLSTVGIVILLMAWINYSSLTLSGVEERLKEIATRKTAGASATDVFKQFLTEAATINFIAIFLAIIIIQLIAPVMGYLFHFYVLPWSEIQLTFYMTMLGIITGGIVLSALYPSLTARRYNPRLIYKRHKITTGNPLMHHWLPSVQFASCIVLIILVLTSFSQTDFLLKKGYGVDQSNIVVVDFPVLHQEKNRKFLPYFINQVNAMSDVRNITVTSSVPSDSDFGEANIKRNTNDISLGIDSNGGVDENFIPFFGIQLIHGRNFMSKSHADTNSVIISRYATVRLGFSSPEKALGTRLLIGAGEKAGHVIGIYEDYEFYPLLSTKAHTRRGSLLTYKDSGLMPWMESSKIAIRVNERNFEETISSIESVYRTSFNDDLFSWYFLDQQVKQRYDAQLTARNQIFIFTGLAIIIGCMGFFGMISFKIIRRTKEIGIRKVMGAELYRITILLLKPTLKQIIIAGAIAIPVAYYYTEQYLQSFSEHIELHWWHFIVPVVVLTVILLSTISSMLWKAANNNPIEALKYE